MDVPRKPSNPEPSHRKARSPLPAPPSTYAILRRVYALLNQQERKRSVFLLLSIFTNSIVEILGLAVIIPVIGLVVQPETIQTNAYLNRAFEITSSIGIDTLERFLILLCAIMISAFLFKALFGLAVNLFQARFSFSVAHRLSGLLWTHHFSKSLERMRSSNSGRLLAEINGWPINFAQLFMVGGVLIISEVTVISLIAGGLLYYNPIVFLSIAGLILTGATIIRTLTKQRLARYSRSLKQLEPHTNSLITNAIRGFLEVITFRASDAVRDAYLKDRKRIFRIQSNTTVLQVSPSKLYEVLAVTAVAGSIIIALMQGTPKAGFLELLTFMAISAYRIMPSMSRLNSAIMSMRSYVHVLEAMEKGGSSPEIKREKPTSIATATSKVDILAKDLTLGYETLEQPVLKNLTHAFQHGKVHGIVGASGSGKSTLISALLCLHRASAGTISIQSPGSQPQDLGSDVSIQDWILNVGYLSQQPFLFQGTVRDNLTLRVPDATVNEDKVLELVEHLQLGQCLGGDPLQFELQEGGSNLSGGQQQRLALLRALQVDRPVLILDEATSALDSVLRDVVFQLLKARTQAGCNVVLVTHDKELAQQCDTVLNLDVA